ncbi:MAG: flavodoxin-dependent (E)-4-hydroxy-3-methylbut-2-enyl-diphosphate synthase [Candidatus Omnitrophica bacterium]|nr:flavodoxin-dependent (E)-4-hydroxy-3-methylbut-2-enyl-diphosphate synthase [Candidatus Omnitrophota bacterium]
MTKVVKIGNLKIGGKNPVRIKGMIKTPHSQIRKVISEAKRLEKEGAESIRIAVREDKDTKIAAVLKKHVSVPIVADIHFHYKLALGAIEEGFDGIRLNPSNISKEIHIRQVARVAKNYNVSIRVGVNSGGFKKEFANSKQLADDMVKRVQQFLKILEKENFFDVMVSLKGADVVSTIIANEMFSKKFDYPLHLGVTATGPFLEGVVKSSIGIGSLLSRGIGSVLRVSLAAPSFVEIQVAKHILQSLNLRRFEPDIISCPTCSRCEVNLIAIVDKCKKELALRAVDKSLKVAIMGCVVNGPGEAYQADIGVAFGGKDKAAIFKKDKILGWTDEKRVVGDLMREVTKIKGQGSGVKGQGRI